MKFAAITLLVFSALTANAQRFVSESIDQNKILFRGFMNQVRIGQVDGTNSDYEIKATNCEVTKGKDAHTYIIKTTSREKTASLEFISNGRSLDKLDFVIQNLPSPDVYWGYAQSGKGFSSSQDLTVHYGPGVSIKADFRVTSYEIIHGDHKFSASGSKLNVDFMKYASSLKKGETIAMTVKVLSPDGITRMIPASWTK